MKSPGQILQILPKIPRRLTIFVNGSWIFVAPPAKPNFTKNKVEYYKMRFKFGITDEFETNPRQTLGLGRVEDYLVVDAYSVYSIMTKEKFALIYPPKLVGISSHTMRTSRDLAQPGYLESIIEEYTEGPSNIPTGASPTPSTGGGTPSTGGGGGY